MVAELRPGVLRFLVVQRRDSDVQLAGGIDEPLWTGCVVCAKHIVQSATAIAKALIPAWKIKVVPRIWTSLRAAF